MNNASVFWFTGLSGSGKTAISEATKLKLQLLGLNVFILDGDIVRRDLHRSLGFSKSDIKENNKLVLDLCLKYRQEYDIILVSIISPYKSSRSLARKKLGKEFYEIYIETDKKTLYERDTKGLYKMALNGEKDNLIGFSSSNIYEPPKNPELKIDTGSIELELSVDIFYEFVVSNLKNVSNN